LMDWTQGRALIATGTAFQAVNVAHTKVRIAQSNNSYIFPGLALGIVASKARRITDSMIKAAAQELARHLPTRNDKNASPLPPLAEARHLSRLIDLAVGRQAIQNGLTEVADQDSPQRELLSYFWQPVYLPVRA